MGSETSGKNKKETILKILEDYELQLASLKQERDNAIKQARDAKSTLTRREAEHENQIGQIEDYYKNQIDKLAAAINDLEKMIEAMGGETQAPPTYPAYFLWLGKKIPFTPPPSETDPNPATIELQEAWVRVYGKAQTVIVSPRINLEELKRGMKVVVRENDSGRYATLVRIDSNQEPAGGESIQPIKKIEGSNVAIIDVGGGHKYFTIRESCGALEAGDMVVIDNESNVVICKAPQLEEEVDRRKLDPVTYKDVGGLKEQIEQIREVVFLPFEKPEVFIDAGIRPPRSILLDGPPGTGKTLLARATANEADMLFFAFSGATFRSAYPGEDVKRLELLFKEARKTAKKTGRPVIIFIDEVESLAPDRSKLHAGDQGLMDMVNGFLACMQGLENRGDVVVMAATNRRETMDDAAIRRFDKIVAIPVPSRDGRKEIIAIHTRRMSLNPDVDIEEIVEKTHGYTGNDIERMCIETALKAYREFKDILKPGERLTIQKKHFLEVLKHMRPAGTGELVITDTGVTFKDIAGLHDIKRQLKREIDLLLGNVGKVAKRLGLKPRKGILIIGPPGTGKTLLAKAVANEYNMNFIPVKGTDIRVCWVGESARNFRRFFELARRHGMVLLFLDEIDAILPIRGTGIGGVRVDEQMVASFNEEMDGIAELQNVIVLAATNRPDLLDPAVYRRLTGGGQPIYIPNLSHEDRIECFQIYTRDTPLADDVDLDYLAKLIGQRKMLIRWDDGKGGFKDEVLDCPFNGNEIRAVCEEAIRAAEDEFLARFGYDEEKADEHADECFVCQKHFLDAIAQKLHLDRAHLEGKNTPPQEDLGDFVNTADELSFGVGKEKAGPPEPEPELDL